MGESVSRARNKVGERGNLEEGERDSLVDPHPGFGTVTGVHVVGPLRGTEARKTVRHENDPTRTREERSSPALASSRCLCSSSGEL